MHAIFLTFKRIAVGDSVLRREGTGKIAFIRKSVRDRPMNVRLPHIRERLPFKEIVLMPEHTTLEISEFLKDIT